MCNLKRYQFIEILMRTLIIQNGLNNDENLVTQFLIFYRVPPKVLLIAFVIARAALY